MSKLQLGNHDKIQYVKDACGKDVGILLAIVEDNKVHIGWSFVHPVKEKSGFNKEFGQLIALDRAYSLTTRPGNIKSKIPTDHFEDVSLFVERCHKYYKDKIFPTWTNCMV